MLMSMLFCSCGGPAFIKETERAIKQLGLKGIFIHSSHNGRSAEDDEARPRSGSWSRSLNVTPP